MQMEMTQRDKKLLMYLGLFVVIVCFGYWGIRPLVKGIMATDEAIAEAQIEKDINALKLAELPMYTADNEELEESILTARSSFYPMMSADQIDKMITGKILEYNLSAYDLSISMPTEEVESEPYIHSESYRLKEEATQMPETLPENNTNTLERVDEYAQGTGAYAEEMEVAPSTGIYAARINMRVGGDPEVLQMLIDDLSSSEEKQLVRAYNWEDDTSIIVNDRGNYEYVSERCLNVTLDIYMCEE